MRSSRTDGTRCASCTSCASRTNRPLWSSRASGTRCARRTYGSSRTNRPLRSSGSRCASGTRCACCTGCSSRTDESLRSSCTDSTRRTRGTDRSSRTNRSLRSSRTDGTRCASCTSCASRTNRSLRSSGSRCASGTRCACCTGCSSRTDESLRSSCTDSTRRTRGTDRSSRTNRSLRSSGSRCASGTRCACCTGCSSRTDESLRSSGASGTRCARRTCCASRTNRSLRSSGASGTRCASCTSCASRTNRPLRPSCTSRASGTCCTGCSSRTDGSLRSSGSRCASGTRCARGTGCSSRTNRPLRSSGSRCASGTRCTDRSSRTNRSLRPSSTDGTRCARGTDCSSRTNRSLRPSRTDGARCARCTDGASRTNRSLRSSRSRCAGSSSGSSRAGSTRSTGRTAGSHGSSCTGCAFDPLGSGGPQRTDWAHRPRRALRTRRHRCRNGDRVAERRERDVRSGREHQVALQAIEARHAGTAGQERVPEGHLEPGGVVAAVRQLGRIDNHPSGPRRDGGPEQGVAGRDSRDDVLDVELKGFPGEKVVVFFSERGPERVPQGDVNRDRTTLQVDESEVVPEVLVRSLRDSLELGRFTQRDRETRRDPAEEESIAVGFAAAGGKVVRSGRHEKRLGRGDPDGSRRPRHPEQRFDDVVVAPGLRRGQRVRERPRSRIRPALLVEGRGERRRALRQVRDPDRRVELASVEPGGTRHRGDDQVSAREPGLRQRRAKREGENHHPEGATHREECLHPNGATTKNACRTDLVRKTRSINRFGSDGAVSRLSGAHVKSKDSKYNAFAFETKRDPNDLIVLGCLEPRARMYLGPTISCS